MALITRFLVLCVCSVLFVSLFLCISDPESLVSRASRATSNSISGTQDKVMLAQARIHSQDDLARSHKTSNKRSCSESLVWQQAYLVKAYSESLQGVKHVAVIGYPGKATTSESDREG